MIDFRLDCSSPNVCECDTLCVAKARKASGVGSWISHRRSQSAKANLECVKGCKREASGVARSLVKPPFPQILTLRKSQRGQLSSEALYLKKDGSFGFTTHPGVEEFRSWNIHQKLFLLFW